MSRASGNALAVALPGPEAAIELLAIGLDARQTGMCLFDSQGRVASWNRTFVDLYPEFTGLLAPGISNVELARAFYRGHLPTAELPSLERHVAAFLQRYRNRPESYSIQRKDGTWIEFDWRRLDSGFQLWLSTLKSARRQGLKDEPYGAEIIAHIDQALALFDTNGVFLAANRAYFALFPEAIDLNRRGVPYSHHLQRIFATVLDASERPGIDALLRRPQDEIGGSDEAVTLRRRQGGWLALAERRVEVGAVLSIWTDVSEQVEAQRAVTDLQGRLTDAIESLADGFALYDSHDRAVIWNQRYRRMGGFVDGDLRVGAAWEELTKKRLERGNFRSAIGREEAWLAERRAERLAADAIQEIELSNGRWLRVTDRRTRDGGTVSIYADITDFKNREVELSRYSAMLSAISYAAANLIGRSDWEAVIHDLIARLGNATEVSRVVIFQCDEVDAEKHGDLAQTCRFEWAAPGITPVKHHPANQEEMLAATDGGGKQWLHRRLRGEIVQMLVRDLSGYMHAKFSSENILSMVTVPIMVGGHLWGHIDFDDCRQERVWSELEIDVLKTVAVLLAEIMERARVDVELGDAEQRFRSIAEALPVIITGERQDTIVYASPPAGALLGVPAASLIGRAVTEIYADPDDVSRLARRFREAGALDDAQTRLRRANGSSLPVALTARRIVYDGQPALIRAYTDLTERQSAESEIARQREALHQADKLGALGSLLAGVAHELNNPLTILIGQSLLLEEALQATAGGERAKKIRSAAERCSRIVKTFLSMARQRPTEHAAVELRQTVDDVLELIGYSIRANGIEIEHDLAPNLPSLWCDEDQLSQLLLNLLINAQQALLEVQHVRRLRISARAEPGAGLIVLEVVDNGPGVPTDLQQHIFEPFFTTKPVGVGTGIGLSLCHSIVNSHNGTIEVTDADGGGAIFRVTLPAPARTPGLPDERQTQMSIASSDGTAGEAILIVDDEPQIAELLAEILAVHGYETVVAHSGREALRNLDERPFALILSDVRMPDLDGPGLYQALQESRPEMTQRLIFVTGDTLQIADTPAINDEIPTIEKPFDPADIAGTVAAHLEWVNS